MNSITPAKRSRWQLWFLLTLLTCPSLVQAAFYQENGVQWNYRAPITLDAQAAPGSTIVLNVDLADLIGQTSAPGTLEPNSIRIVKNDVTLINEQEFNDSVFMGANDALDNSQGEVRFILEDAPGTATYFVYFDINANGPKPASPATQINGTFEQSVGAPIRWTTTAQNAGGAQNNEVYDTDITTTTAIPAGCSTGGATLDNSPNNNGTSATGRRWHLIGYRDNCEDGSGGNELIRLTRTLRVPAGTAAGELTFSFQVQAFDGISNATNYDWFNVSINNNLIDHRNMGVVAGSPALVVEATRFGRSAFGTGLIDHGWRDATLSLAPFAGTTISLRFEARFSSSDNAYRSWMKLDDVAWSESTGTVGTPELDAISLARFQVQHDTAAIYCLGEPIRVVAVDVTGAQIPDFAGTMNLDTQQGSGVFSLTQGSGPFSSNANGTATYTFVPTDGGQALFTLNYPSGNTPIDIDALLDGDPTISDDDSEGVLAFSPNGFTFTANPISNPPPSPINTNIPTQTAATLFDLYLTAYGVTDDDPTCGVIETYTGSRPVSFWQSYVNPTSGSLVASVNGANIAPSAALATPQTIIFSAGQASVQTAYPDVGEIRLHASDVSSGSVTIAGATNTFVVKPARLVISRIESTGGTPNPAATTLSGAGFVAAGESFVVDVDSLNANNVLTPNFGRESVNERIEIRSESLLLPVGGINGSSGDVVNGAVFTATATAGRFTNSTVLFDETGIISLRPKLSDDDYLGGGDVIRPTVPAVGRFYPARFELLTGSISASCGSFTYMDEPNLGISYELQALNVAGLLTTNYSDNLYGSNETADLIISAENANNGVDLTGRLISPQSNWIAGRRSATTTLRFQRDVVPDGPFTSLALGARIIDNLDSNIISGANSNAATTGDCTTASNCNAIQIDSETSVYYGRALVLPAQGPETSSLPIEIEAQFFNGTEFQRNTLDNCSSYSSALTTLSNFTDNLQAGETSVVSPPTSTSFSAGLTQGTAPLLLSAPGAGNTGTLELLFNTELWLRFDWLGTGETNPSAVATFGGFRGHDRVIYWQEQR